LKEDKLNLPTFAEPLPGPKILSMDEYYEFIQFHLKNTHNEKAYWEWKALIAVDEPFTIK